MISIFVILLAILLGAVAYKLIQSFRFKSFYAKNAIANGYKVYEHPYCWLGSQMYSEFIRQFKLYRDANYHYKHELSKYDIIVSNLVFKTMIEV